MAIVGVEMIGIVGIFGMLCIVLAWIPQTIRTIKTKKVGMEEKFLWIYLLGSSFLTLYAMSIKDLIFFTLNSVAVIFDIINIYYYYVYEKTTISEEQKKKEKKGEKGKK